MQRQQEQEELEKTRWMEEQRMVQVPKQSFPRMVEEKQMKEVVAVPHQMDHSEYQS